jgi:hypothetical protein
MIVDHGANFEGEAPPVAPAGRHAVRQDMVFSPVRPRRQPRGALVIARIRAFVGTLFMARQKLRAPTRRGSS